MDNITGRQFDEHECQKDGWIFVLNSLELDRYGFEGELNDLKDALNDIGADVSEEMDEDYNEVFFITNASLKEMYEILSNFGVEDIDELLNGEDEDDNNLWDE